MNLKNCRIGKEDGSWIYQVEAETSDGKRILWYKLDDEYGGLISESYDAALVGLLIPAMALGEDIRISGQVSESLLWNNRRLQRVLRWIMPALHDVAIIPEGLTKASRQRAVGVATGFSGGIDSFCLCMDNLGVGPATRHRLTHLLFNNVGSHGVGGQRLFHKRYERLVAVAKRLNLPLVKVDSNLEEFYSKRLNFEQTNSLRNASVPFLLQEGIGRFYYASAYPYQMVRIGPANDTAYCDPVILALLSTEELDTQCVGSEYTRVEKTLLVAQFPETYDSLDVCTSAGYSGKSINCSKCPKCLRTLATLEIAGLLGKYASSFDLETYKKKRISYWASLPGSKDHYLIEILQFAKKRGIKMPVAARVLCINTFIASAPGKICRGILRCTKKAIWSAYKKNWLDTDKIKRDSERL